MRNLLNEEEIGKVRDCVEQSTDIKENSYGREDGLGRISRLALWSYAGDDVLGVVTR